MFGIFKAVASVGSFLFGGESKQKSGTSNAMEAAKGVGNWIDEQQFTEEEKSAAHANNTKTLLAAIAHSQNENSTRSVTRRVLAWAIMGTFLLAFWICVFLIFREMEEMADKIKDLMDEFMLPELALAVGSFYFMVSLVRSRK
jgi:Fe2+ transport system protein B